MAEQRHRAEWQQTSAIIWGILKAAGAKGVKPDSFDPYRDVGGKPQWKDLPKVGISALKVFLRKGSAKVKEARSNADVQARRPAVKRDAQSDPGRQRPADRKP